MVLLQPVKQRLGVLRRIKVHNISRVLRIYVVNVLPQLRPRLSRDVLNLLESPRLDKGPLGLQILWQDLSELTTHVSQYLSGGHL